MALFNTLFSNMIKTVIEKSMIGDHGPLIDALPFEEGLESSTNVFWSLQFAAKPVGFGVNHSKIPSQYDRCDKSGSLDDRRALWTRSMRLWASCC
jgi:hypothetical protein